MHASRKDWFAHADRRVADYAIEGWRTIRIQSLTAAEHDALALATTGEEPKAQFVEFAIKTILDPETDLPMFSEIDRERLGSIDYPLSRRIWTKILEHCAIGPDLEVSDDDLKKS